MQALERTTRTATEVAGMRALADARRGRSAFQERHQGGVVDALDWVEGARDAAPATGEVRVADDQGIGDELMAARQQAHDARGTDAATRPHAVAVTLAWFLLAGNESPA